MIGLATFVSSSAVGAEDKTVIEEIIITAQFKEKGLQDSGLAVDAIGGRDLVMKGLNDVYALSDMVPALTITSGAGISAQLFMRGVGNRAGSTYADPAIILTYDGVAIARGSSSSIAAFYDIERVEVLKGPQGTLYGKNATGGVVNIVPVGPKIGVSEGFISGSVGNYNAHEISGGFNLPVGATSAVRIAGSVIKRDGYNKDGSSDDDRKSVRAQFLTEPNDQLSIRFAADYTHVGGVGAGATPIGSYARNGVGDFSFVRNDLALNEGAQTDAANDFRSTVLAAPGFGFLTPIQDEFYVNGTLFGFNAEINYEFEAGMLTIIPAYRKVEQDTKFGQPGFNSGWWNSSAEQKTVEIRFAGDAGDSVDYIVGGFYFSEDMEGNNTFNQEFVLPLQDYQQSAESMAIFGELTWSIDDSTRVIFGARYTDDKKSMHVDTNTFVVFCGGLPPGLITPPGSFAHGCATPGNLPHFPTLDTAEQAYDYLFDNGYASTVIDIPGGHIIPLDNGVGTILHSVANLNTEYSATEPTYRISFEKDILEDTLLYASYSHGYRSGGLEPTSNVYQAEFLDAFTLGMKNTFAEGSIQLNLEAFYWKYEDQQISYFNLDENNVLQNSTENIGGATIKGIEIDFIWAATENTRIDATVQYLDANYDDLHFYTSAPRDNINCPFTVTDAGGLDFNCSGNQAIYSPKWTINLGLEQTFPLSNGMLVIAALDTRYVSDQVAGFMNLDHDKIEGHTTTNINVTLESAESDWYVSLYAKNLENKRRVQVGQGAPIGVALVTAGPNLTYGLRFGVNF